MAILDAGIALVLGILAFGSYFLGETDYWIYLLGAGYFIVQSIWRAKHAYTK